MKTECETCPNLDSVNTMLKQHQPDLVLQQATNYILFRMYNTATHCYVGPEFQGLHEAYDFLIKAELIPQKSTS